MCLSLYATAPRRKQSRLWFIGDNFAYQNLFLFRTWHYSFQLNLLLRLNLFLITEPWGSYCRFPWRLNCLDMRCEFDRFVDHSRFRSERYSKRKRILLQRLLVSLSTVDSFQLRLFIDSIESILSHLVPVDSLTANDPVELFLHRWIGWRVDEQRISWWRWHKHTR